MMRTLIRRLTASALIGAVFTVGAAQPALAADYTGRKVEYVNDGDTPCSSTQPSPDPSHCDS